jgi:hypothetical protein
MTDTFTPPIAQSINGHEIQPAPDVERTANGRRVLMICRYDSTHGTFPNPVRLKEHYVSEHASEYAAPKSTQRVQCNLCDKEIAQGVASGHMRKQHRRADWQTLIRPAGASNPFALDAPYIDEAIVARLDALPHEQRRALKRRCLLCPVEIIAKNFSRHARVAHHRDDWQACSVWADALRTEPVEPVVESKPKPSQAIEVVETKRARALRNQHRLDANQIVIGTAAMLASPTGMIPVDALEALLDWKDHTQTMLDAVTGQPRE